MKVFVTGAAGFIGKAVVQELLNNGHQVLGLARSDHTAEAVKQAGAEVHRGDMEDLESLKSGAKKSDGVIHLAFIHDFTNFEKSLAVDRAAITAMAEAMEGSDKPLVITGGTLILPGGRVATEDTQITTFEGFGERAQSEELIKKFSREKQIRGCTVRLSPSVHGEGDKGFVPMLINFAKQAGYVTIVGDQSAHWPAVHRMDAAVLFRLAVEKGEPGAAYHGVAEQGVSIDEIMDKIGKKLQLPVEKKSPEEAQKSVGFFTYFLGADNRVSSAITQKQLGWQPKQLGLLADMDANYFN